MNSTRAVRPDLLRIDMKGKPSLKETSKVRKSWMTSLGWNAFLFSRSSTEDASLARTRAVNSAFLLITLTLVYFAETFPIQRMNSLEIAKSWNLLKLCISQLISLKKFVSASSTCLCCMPSNTTLLGNLPVDDSQAGQHR
jgi:hypothetical protein